MNLLTTLIEVPCATNLKLYVLITMRFILLSRHHVEMKILTVQSLFLIFQLEAEFRKIYGAWKNIGVTACRKNYDSRLPAFFRMSYQGQHVVTGHELVHQCSNQGKNGQNEEN